MPEMVIMVFAGTWDKAQVHTDT